MAEQLQTKVLGERVVAIVQFGPAGLDTDGMRAGQYYQVAIDPRKMSPSGEMIRFGDSPGDEIVGWQRCRSMTIIEVLAEWPYDQVWPGVLSVEHPVLMLAAPGV